MRRLLLVAACLALASPAFAQRLPGHADQVVDYRIDVTLDAEQKQLHGREQLTWRNPSAEPVADLWFHLYLNAFKNTESTFMRESGGQLRGDRMAEGKWGWIDVKSFQVNGGEDVASDGRFEHPDDDNAADRTVWRVPLAQPVAPGGTVTLDLAFTAQLPQVFARSGYAGDYFLAGQWFPKVGVYEPAGMRGRAAPGWNCHQYHANSEFYADFGHYLVNITIPSRFVVGATGRRTAEHPNPDGTVTYTYEQGDVHDFAWTADPRFIEVKRRFSATTDVTPAEYAETARLLDRSLDEVRLSDVEIILLLQPQHRPQLERHIRAVKAAIKYYGLWYGRYPYPTITVVDPDVGGGGSGGMEYPTFITAGTTFLINSWPFEHVMGPEMVTVHEFGHQFWYGMVANNEFEEAWLDEGINSYSTGRVMETAYAAEGAQMIPGTNLSERDTLRMINGPDQKFNRILRPAWEYTGNYGFYSYMKPEIVLRTLENYLGHQTWARVMRTYQERWRFRHPCTDDFFAVVNEVSGQDLSWYLDAAIRGSSVLDYEVAAVSSLPVEPPGGVFDENGGRVTKTAADQRAARKANPKPLYENRVLVQRRGGMIMPVEIALTFDNGTVERVRWDGRDRWKRLVLTRPERLVSANIDPDRKIELDVDWLNNGRRVAPDGRVAAKWGASLLFVVQTLLAWAGM